MSDLVEQHVEKHLKRAEAGAQEKADMTIVNKAVHSIGGELALFELVSRGMTKKRMLETLGVSRSAFDRWVQKTAERAARYSRAREEAADSLADETLEIADEADPQTAQVAKLRIEARRWLAAKINPEAYGDKTGPSVTLNLGDMMLDSLRKRSVTVLDSGH
jgi:predicted transcriptional regulator